MTFTTGFLFGVFGGCLPELMVLNNAKKNGLPQYLRSLFFWLVTLSMVFSGGILVIAYLSSGNQLTPVIAINIGASAPLIIASFARTAPQIEPGSID